MGNGGQFSEKDGYTYSDQNVNGSSLRGICILRGRTRTSCRMALQCWSGQRWDGGVEGCLGGQAAPPRGPCPLGRSVGTRRGAGCNGPQQAPRPWHSHCALPTFIVFLLTRSWELFRIATNSHVPAITKSIWLRLQMAAHCHPSVWMPGAFVLLSARVVSLDTGFLWVLPCRALWAVRLAMGSPRGP